MCPSSVRRSSLPFTPHSCTVLYSDTEPRHPGPLIVPFDPIASTVPSGENTTLGIEDSTTLIPSCKLPCPSSLCRSSPSPALHNLVSYEPEAISVPSGEKATQFTIPLCPSSVCRSSPLFTFHNLMVLSPEAEAISVPSGENATSLTLRLCPSSACRSSPLFTLHNRTV